MRTHNLIQKAFQELLEQKSFQDITVQDITDRAMVNRATFYSHFETKYELLDHCINEWFYEKLHCDLPESNQFNPLNVQRLIVGTCEALSIIRDQYVPSKEQLPTFIERQVTQQLYEIIFDWLKAAPLDFREPGVTPELAAVVTSWGIYGATLQWSEGSRAMSAQEFARQALPLILCYFNPSV